MSTAPKAAAFALLLRIALRGASRSAAPLGAAALDRSPSLSMTVGNLGALSQHNVKRMLAYSVHRPRRLPAGRLHRLRHDGIAAAASTPPPTPR